MPGVLAAGNVICADLESMGSGCHLDADDSRS
jgi:hypothetical protein